MLRDFYVIDEGGIAEYEWHAPQDAPSDPDAPAPARINAQLISGLVTALLQFSKSVFLEEMQTLALENALMVVTKGAGKPIRYAVGIYDAADHRRPAKALNRRLLRAFTAYRGPRADGTTVSQAQFPLEPLFHRGKLPVAIPRTLRWTLVVLFVGTAVILAFLLGVPPLFAGFQDFVASEFLDAAAYGVIVVGFMLPYLIFGFFMGTWLRGMLLGWTSVGIVVIVLGLLLHAMGTPFVFSLYDLITVLAMAASTAGGLVAQLFFLSGASRATRARPSAGTKTSGS